MCMTWGVEKSNMEVATRFHDVVLIQSSASKAGMSSISRPWVLYAFH